MSWEKIGETDIYNIWINKDNVPFIWNVFLKDYVPNNMTGGYTRLETILEIKHIKYFTNQRGF